MRWILQVSVAAVVLLALAACPRNTGLDFSQVFVGSNGPEFPAVSFHDSADAVERSWIKSALTQEQMRNVLNGVDFEHQILLAFASGQSMLPSESSIAITSVRQIGSSDNRPIDVTVEIGRCGSVIAESRLFVLAALERPVGSTGSSGGYSAYYTDACTESASAKDAGDA